MQNLNQNCENARRLLFLEVILTSSRVINNIQQKSEERSYKLTTPPYSN